MTAAALIVDYVMTVAVSLSAATAALTSAFPEMAQYRVGLALFLLCAVTILNLRGMRESSKVFGVPTYAFILVMAALIAAGFWRLAAGTLSPVRYDPAQVAAGPGLGTVSLFLLLRAFSPGCSALTGIEEVSNAVPAFRGPTRRNARHVLFILVGIMIFIFGGSVLLVSRLGLSVFGPGALFYVLQFVTSLILLLAANTACDGLPTLLAILAGDGYMPRQFMHRGARLSFSNGIMFIFFTAAILLVVFSAKTRHLIPLYSIGVFLSFTLSQSGMVARWLRTKDRGYRHKLLVNGLGALMTGTGTAIVFVTKFEQGSWALAVVIPAVAALMILVERHYQFVSRQLKADNFMSHYRKSIGLGKNLCVVLVGTLEEYVRRKEAELAPGDMITVLMARYMEKSWFANLLHNQTAYFIMHRLRAHRNVATVLVPYLYSSEFKPASAR